MKTLKYLILFLLLSTLGYSQGLHTSVITAGDSIGTIIKLPAGEIPNAVYTYTSGVDKKIEFYIFVGDTTGYSTSLTRWQLLSTVGDASIAYFIYLLTGSYIPLDYDVFESAIGKSLTGGSASYIYIKPYIVGTAVGTTTLYIRTLIRGEK